MATLINERMKSLEEKISRFAKDTIAGRNDLHVMEDFPFDIWQKMAVKRLLGLGIPEEYGGLGENYLAIAIAGEAMVRSGHNMGIALSWLIHHMTSRLFIAGAGTENQKEKYLPDMARGKITASVAISEPDVGAHPKHLKTTAEGREGFFILNGEKSYLTNGPIANLFIVIAITGIEDGRKRFTAFLVPAETKGLQRTEPIRFPFLRPSPHGGIMLQNCSLPSSNILGNQGTAYEEMVIPFREYEDVLLMGPASGAMQGQIELLVELIRKQGVSSLNDNLKADLGELQSLADTLRIIAYESANMLESGTGHHELLSLSLSFRSISKNFQDKFALVKTRASIESTETLDFLTNDLVSMLPIAKNISSIKQRKLGETLISGRRKNEITH
jgi:alkylation response protein AidB-like acyl-CoA dehydrogenase